MKYIIYGVGAIGGGLAARLALSGHEVCGIARGAQLQALQNGPLKLHTPEGPLSVDIKVVADPSDLDISPTDVIILTMKSQDTQFALNRLREIGLYENPIVCAQNGVDNERMAQRLFPNVYAMTVMMPATYVVPGEVALFATPHTGLFYVGCYPHGTDKHVDALCETFNAAGLAAFPRPDTMNTKYSKFIMNLANIIDAALPSGTDPKEFADLVGAEGKMVLDAAGIAVADGSEMVAHQAKLMKFGSIEGISRVGSSSAQSLARHTGSIETDYLNGEIVLLGKLHGIATPINAYFCQLAHKILASGEGPGSVSVEQMRADFAQLSL